MYMKIFTVFCGFMILAIVLAFMGASFPLWVGIGLITSGYLIAKKGLSSSKMNIRRISSIYAGLILASGAALCASGFVFRTLPWNINISQSSDARFVILSMLIHFAALVDAPILIYAYCSKIKTLRCHFKRQIKYTSIFCGLADAHKFDVMTKDCAEYAKAS